MDYRSFAERYRELIRISDVAADIYGSELGQDIVSGSCPEASIRPSAVLLKMQLEQERFLRLNGDHGGTALPETGELSLAFHRAVCGWLGDRLGHLRGEQRRGILLDLLGGLDRDWTERDRLAAARLTEEELTALAAARVAVTARRLCAAQAAPGGEATAETERAPAGGSCSATAAALSIAAYAGCPDLRAAPGLIADTSAAAAKLACAEDGREAEPLAGTAYMMLIVTAALLIDLLEAAPPVGGAGPALDAAADLFAAHMRLFSTELGLIAGAEAAGAVARAADALAEAGPEAAPSQAGAGPAQAASVDAGIAPEPADEAKEGEEEPDAQRETSS